MGTATNQAERQTQFEATPEIVDALLEAARYDDLEDITSLASSGVSLDSKDSLGRTALHMAAANGHLDIVEYLINQGVDLNASNEEKNTPLHWACLNGHIEVVKKLILAGASLGILNSHERTPMDEAVTRGKLDVIDAINSAVAQQELAGVTVSYFKFGSYVNDKDVKGGWKHLRFCQALTDDATGGMNEYDSLLDLLRFIKTSLHNLLLGNVQKSRNLVERDMENL
ncbi:hypothetical protein POTOM_032960 [Populus tomentosa]|uniref:Ankyrin repeat family protein n=1 Tax=Populus tomentosa TaxID=118781 RepID=A0A8X7ZFP8_POPTO|nr:hypothetical protein POTOM_032960 [Populus tomentosa]